MNFGLDDYDFELFCKLVVKPLKENSFKIFIFGSRAKNKNHPFSDIDVLVKPPDQKNYSTLISHIRESVEESRFPIKVDLVLWNELAEHYRATVEREKIEI